MQLLWCACLLGVLGVAFSAAPVVRVAEGQLRGKHYVTRDGRTVYGFLGIPFAKPPTGDLRFRSPLPAEKWSGVRSAIEDGPPCSQNNLLDYRNRNVTFGDEDCLYLNVFTPALSINEKLPVMVYIFGGGFFAGSATSELYSPDYLLDKDIVLVVISYRVGVLGFLSTEDDVLPGNYGLKDQTEALRWVQRNIHVFGGNKDSVTLFGNSAGAGSVHLHMMSPLSQGLFHAGISQSGSALCQWAMAPPGSNRNTALRVARQFGCPTADTEALAECLRAVPADRLSRLTYEYLVFDLDPVVTFPPSIENYCSMDAFLTEDPWTITTWHPWISGLLSQEGSMRTSSLTRGGAEGVARVAKLNDNYKQLLPASIMVERHAKDPVAIAEKVKGYYFGNGPISKSNLQQLINMYSDSWFTYCSTEAVRRHKGPVYQYYISYKGNKSVAPLFGNNEDDLGVCHVDELIYLFPLDAYFPNRTDPQSDITFSKTLVTLWTNFARYRNPTPNSSPFKWTPVSSEKNYLHISRSGYTMEKDLLKERFEFWRDLPFREKPSLS